MRKKWEKNKNYNFKFKKIKILILIQIKNIISNYFPDLKLFFKKKDVQKNKKLKNKKAIKK